MSLFVLSEGKVHVDPSTLTIPELKEIYERTNDKELVFKELAFVYHMADYKSPYNNQDFEERLKKVSKDFGITPDDLLLKAVDQYKALSVTPSMRALESCEKGLKTIEHFLNTVDLDQKDTHGKPIYNVRDIHGSVANMGKMIESIAKLKDQVKKEQSTGSKIRGDKKIGMFEH